jgi:hypothetical protein
MLMKRDEDGELRPPQWELEESSFEELSAELTEGTITRARAIKLAGAALLSASGLMMLFQSPAEAGRRRKRRKRRQRRQRRPRARTNRRRVRFPDTEGGTTSPVENVTITNIGPEPIFVSPDLGDNSFTFAPTFDATAPILPGESVTVPIIFAPTLLEEGIQTGELSIVDTDGEPVVVVDANGNTVEAIKLEGTALPAL